MLYRYIIKLWYNPLSKIYCRIKKVKLGQNVDFNGFMSIRRKKNSHIIIGNHCRFHSRKFALPIVLNSPCRIVTTDLNAQIFIGDFTGASGVNIVASTNINIGQNVLIGSNTTIVDTDFHSSNPNSRINNELKGKPIVIENNVFIGMNCVILKGVRIGENSVIGANSVVMKDIAPNSIAMGNPCTVLIKRKW